MPVTEISPRFQVVSDGLTLMRHFDRRYAVIDTAALVNERGQPKWVLQTDDPRRAREYADELNGC